MKIKYLMSLLTVSLVSVPSVCQEKGYIKFNSTKELQEYFNYSESSSTSILISGHRGGREAHYPENSIEGFENVLNQMPAFFEIDPRLTKDSVIVLMHDGTLDRTSTGTGKISEYTWEQLQSIRLKDSEGNITSAKIPKLEEVIIWSKGKTVVNLDKKDVPLSMIVALIKKHKADKSVMVTVHTGAQARYYYDRLPNIMMSVFCRNDKEYEDISLSGVPWRNMIAYVGHTITEQNKHIVDKLHSNGVRCMISTSPTHDKLNNVDLRLEKYKEEVAKHPDIIESDIPTEVWRVVE